MSLSVTRCPGWRDKIMLNSVHLAFLGWFVHCLLSSSGRNSAQVPTPKWIARWFELHHFYCWNVFQVTGDFRPAHTSLTRLRSATHNSTMTSSVSWRWHRRSRYKVRSGLAPSPTGQTTRGSLRSSLTTSWLPAGSVVSIHIYHNIKLGFHGRTNITLSKIKGPP